MDLHIGHDGHPVVLFSVRKGDMNNRRIAGQGGKDHRYYYARWDGLAWQTHEICHGGSALYKDEEDFSGLAAVDPSTLNIIYVSTDANPISGEPLISQKDGLRHFEIYKGISGNHGKSWSWEAITKNSNTDNIRPIIPIWPGDRRVIMWMRGSYKHYTNYDTDIVGFIEKR